MGFSKIIQEILCSVRCFVTGGSSQKYHLIKSRQLIASYLLLVWKRNTTFSCLPPQSRPLKKTWLSLSEEPIRTLVRWQLPIWKRIVVKCLTGTDLFADLVWLLSGVHDNPARFMNNNPAKGLALTLPRPRTHLHKCDLFCCCFTSIIIAKK